MSTADLLAELREYVGRTGTPQLARHPVTGTAIADFCDAVGDDNPCYRDEEYAAKSRHGGIVAPPAMLDVWDRPGLPAQTPEGRATDEPRSPVLRLLETHGFVGVVAVNSELELSRYLRPGELVQHVQQLVDVSDAKQTALGVGHFVTTRQRYTTVDGEHVGDLMFRVLKFRPGTGRPARADPTGPDSNPALRPRPGINRDNLALWDGYRQHELRIPRCGQCGALTFPPTPRCARCGSFEMGHLVASGRGTLYAKVVVHHPQVAGFRYPLCVGLVELEEGTRMLADVVGCTPDQARVGMPLQVAWLDSHPALEEGATDARGPISLPQFIPGDPPRRTETLRARDLAIGDELPLWVLPVTATRVVSGALASRDFQTVHHDREMALRQGSADIFFNINTSVGYLQRYLTDWSGPEAVLTALRVRLGAPAYPGSLLSFSGTVESVEPDTGRVCCRVRAVNELGQHVDGSVELELPQ
jgi:uncharacterized OB-fold protein/acyl dehydratase